MQIGGDVCGEQTPWASLLHLPGILELWGPKHDLATPPNPSVKLITAKIPVLFRMYLAFEKYIKAVSIHCLVQHKGRRLLVTSLGGVVHPAAINKPPHLQCPSVSAWLLRSFSPGAMGALLKLIPTDL